MALYRPNPDFFLRNFLPSGYESSKLEFKGFMPVSQIKDFPIRGQNVIVHIKRKRWTVLETQQIVNRDQKIMRLLDCVSEYG